MNGSLSNGGNTGDGSSFDTNFDASASYLILPLQHPEAKVVANVSSPKSSSRTESSNAANAAAKALRAWMMPLV